MAAGELALLKRRKTLTRGQAIRLWSQKRKACWQDCEQPQWIPPPEVKRPAHRSAANMGGLEISSCF